MGCTGAMKAALGVRRFDRVPAARLAVAEVARPVAEERRAALTFFRLAVLDDDRLAVPNAFFRADAVFFAFAVDDDERLAVLEVERVADALVDLRFAVVFLVDAFFGAARRPVARLDVLAVFLFTLRAPVARLVVRLRAVVVVGICMLLETAILSSR